jgi:hypothetical protein
MLKGEGQRSEVSAEAEGVPSSAEKLALSLFGLLEPIATSSNSRAINTNINFSRARNTYLPIQHQISTRNKCINDYSKNAAHGHFQQRRDKYSSRDWQ